MEILDRLFGRTKGETNVEKILLEKELEKLSRETVDKSEANEEEEVESIIGFTQGYEFLSNKYRTPVEQFGKIYSSPEAALDAKFYSELCIRTPDDNGVRPKLPPVADVMDATLEEYTIAKFKNKGLARQLMETGDKYLNDTIVENKLGKLLMKIRDELNKE